MPIYRLTPGAQADLEHIWDYTAAHWGEAQAERYLRQIQTVCESLADGTRVSQSAEDIRAGYRKAPAGSHMLYFQVQAGLVLIVRILHQSMDVQRHL